MRRETQEDLDREAAILDAFCSEWRCTWRKLGNGGKYRIDAVLERNGEVVAWAEVKSHGGSFAGLNVPKYMEMYHLGQLTGVPAFFLHLREPDRADLREELLAPRLERAIGVIYRPETEVQSHYFHASLPRQFDEYVWIDETRAVRPVTADEARGLARTHPFAT